MAANKLLEESGEHGVGLDGVGDGKEGVAAPTVEHVHALSCGEGVCGGIEIVGKERGERVEKVSEGARGVVAELVWGPDGVDEHCGAELGVGQEGVSDG